MTATRHAAGTFVFAAGPWLPRLFPELLGPLIAVTKQDVVFLGPRPGDGRFAAEWLPCWVDYDGGFYGIPAVDGRGVKIAPDRDGPPFDPTDGERIIDPDTVRQVRAYARTRFPSLAAAPVVETRVCQYETSPDTEFILDRHPDLGNVWIAGGGSGHAFKHGPVIGSYLVSRLAGRAGGRRRGAVLAVAPARARIAPADGSALAGGRLTRQIVAGPVKSLRRFIVYGDRTVASGKIEASSPVAAIQSTWWRLTMIVWTSRASIAPATL